MSPGNIVKLQKLTRVEVIKVDENTVKYKLSSPEMPQFVSEALIEFGKITLGTFIDGRPYKVMKVFYFISCMLVISAKYQEDTGLQ